MKKNLLDIYSIAGDVMACCSITFLLPFLAVAFHIGNPNKLISGEYTLTTFDIVMCFLIFASFFVAIASWITQKVCVGIALKFRNRRVIPYVLWCIVFDVLLWFLHVNEEEDDLKIIKDYYLEKYEFENAMGIHNNNDTDYSDSGNDDNIDNSNDTNNSVNGD